MAFKHLSALVRHGLGRLSDEGTTAGGVQACPAMASARRKAAHRLVAVPGERR